MKTKMSFTKGKKICQYPAMLSPRAYSITHSSCGNVRPVKESKKIAEKKEGQALKVLLREIHVCHRRNLTSDLTSNFRQVKILIRHSTFSSIVGNQ